MFRKSNYIKMGVALSYIAMLVSLLGNLFISNRVLNLIGDHDYGLFSFVNSITSWIPILSTALGGSYYRFATIEANENNESTSKTNTVYFKSLIAISAVILLVLGSIVAYCLLNELNFLHFNYRDSRLIYVLFGILTINIVIIMSSSIFNLYVCYKKRYIFNKNLLIVSTVLTFLGNFLLSYYTRNILIMSLNIVFVSILNAFCNYIYCRKNLEFTFAEISPDEFRMLMRPVISFSGIILINAVVDQINTSIDKTLLGIYSCPENVTIYQMGQQFNVQLITMSVAVSSIFAPKIYELCIKEQWLQINKLYILISKTQTVILSFVAFGFLACGRDFIVWWIGDKRINTFIVASVLMLIDLCPLTLNASIEIQRARNRHKFRAYAYLAFAVMNLLLSILFIKMFKPENVVFACLLGSVIARICSHWISMNIYNAIVIKLPVKEYMINLIVYIFMGILGVVITRIITINIYCKENRALFRFMYEGITFVIVYIILVVLKDKRFISELIKK
ncbi:MAG: hypothetical protein IKQ44_10765 [Lachnospiraceae bacterium]|nr:hypothetical protein [Lachnospiraceae bacterium]